MLECVKEIIKWIFSTEPVELNVTDPAQKLLNSMRITSKCRYNASTRLKRQSLFSFLTTTVLSLGLILIPLLQNSDIQLAFAPKVLNMLQIFLAVAVLVYSVIIATARYETRAEGLNECGDKIKDLIRTLRRALADSNSSGVSVELSKFNQRYDDVSTDAENHTRLDFMLATLEMKTDYKYTGIIRLYMYAKAIFLTMVPYVIPVSLLCIEIVFITDMVGVTKILTPYLQPITAK